MRDDLKKLFNNLILLHSRKLEKLKTLSADEARKKFCLDTNKIDDLLDIIEKDNAMINEIDSIDYDIKKSEEEICRIAGIEGKELKNFIAKREESEVIELRDIYSKTRSCLTGITTAQDEFDNLIDARMGEIDRDIESLSLIRKLKKILPSKD